MPSKKMFGFLSLVLLTFFLFGCAVNQPAAQVNANANKTDDTYVGTWLRQAIYTNGVQVPSEPSTLILTEKGTFFSINDYAYDEGTIKIDGDNITTTVTAGMTPGQVVKHKWQVSSDGKTLTFIINDPSGIEMREVYQKGADYDSSKLPK